MKTSNKAYSVKNNYVAGFFSLRPINP